MDKTQLKSFLDNKASIYESPEFITHDPIQIPHRFSSKEDIEITAFLTATIAWGNRKSIIKNATQLTEIMGNNPYDFIMNYTEKSRDLTKGFVHRTFNAEDLHTFFSALNNIYSHHNGLESVFAKNKNLQEGISQFKKTFFEIKHQSRTQKHVGDPKKGSAAKRLNMFLRWMVRPNSKGVDFGIWKSIGTQQLSCPLDVHSGTTARSLGLLSRKQNDAKAVLELDTQLRKLDPTDPAKYDYALFGLGAFEQF